MKKKTSAVTWGVLALVLLGGVAAAGWYFIDLNPGPDRTGLIRDYLRANWFKDESEEFSIVKCSQVRHEAVRNLRKDYPSLEIVDVTLRHKDAVGSEQTGTHHFWILEDKDGQPAVFWVQGMSFADARGRDPNTEDFVRYKVLEKTDRAAAARFKAQKKEELGEEPGPGGGPGGGGRGGPGGGRGAPPGGG